MLIDLLESSKANGLCPMGKIAFGYCEQRRSRSACAPAQVDQGILCHLILSFLFYFFIN